MKKLVFAYLLVLGYACSQDNSDLPNDPIEEPIVELKLPIALTHDGNETWPDFEDSSLIRFYYTDNKLDSIVHPSGGVTEVTYSDDKIMRMDHHYLSYSHTYDEFQYDAEDQLIQRHFFKSEYYQSYYDYTYNSDGSILEERTEITGPGEINHYYDSNGNLTKSVETVGSGSSAFETIFNYDNGKSPFINMVGMKYFKNLIIMHMFGEHEDGGVNNMVRMDFRMINLTTSEVEDSHVENYENTYDANGYLIKRDGDYKVNNSYFFYNK